jgi:hypothetical protein
LLLTKKIIIINKIIEVGLHRVEAAPSLKIGLPSPHTIASGGG